MFFFCSNFSFVKQASNCFSQPFVIAIQNGTADPDDFPPCMNLCEKNLNCSSINSSSSSLYVLAKQKQQSPSCDYTLSHQENALLLQRMAHSLQMPRLLFQNPDFSTLESTLYKSFVFDTAIVFGDSHSCFSRTGLHFFWGNHTNQRQCIVHNNLNSLSQGNPCVN